MKKRKLLLVTICLVSLLAMNVNAETPPDEVVRAARDGLSVFLAAIPEGELSFYGFANKDELKQATIGASFRIYTIAPDNILSYRGDADISSLLYATDHWVFLVTCSGKARVLLTVVPMEGIWEAVDLGGTSTAAELQEITDTWAASDGYDTKFIRIYQASSDFVLLTKDKASHLVPLKGAALVLGLIRKRETYEYREINPSEILTKLGPVVKASLRAYPQRD